MNPCCLVFEAVVHFFQVSIHRSQYNSELVYMHATAEGLGIINERHRFPISSFDVRSIRNAMSMNSAATKVLQ